MTEQAFGFIKEGFARAKERVLGPKPGDIRGLLEEIGSLTNTEWVKDSRRGQPNAPESIDDPSLRPGFKRKYPQNTLGGLLYIDPFNPDRLTIVTYEKNAENLIDYSLTQTAVYKTFKEGGEKRPVNRRLSPRELRAFESRLLCSAETILCDNHTLKKYGQEYPQLSKHFPELLAARGSWPPKPVEPPVPAFEQPEAKIKVRRLEEGIRKIKTEDFDLGDLICLMEDEAYVEQFMALGDYQQNHNDKDQKKIVDAADNWMAASKVARKALETGVEKLNDEEASVLACAVATLYTHHVLPEKIITDNNNNKKYGIDTIIESLVAEQKKIGQSKLRFVFVRPADPRVEEHSSSSGEELKNQWSRELNMDELREMLFWLREDKGLSLLIRTTGYRVGILTGARRQGYEGGWVRALDLDRNGIFYEGVHGTGSTISAFSETGSVIFAFTYNSDQQDYVSETGEKLLQDRVFHANNYSGMNRTKLSIIRNTRSWLAGTKYTIGHVFPDRDNGRAPFILR